MRIAILIMACVAACASAREKTITATMAATDATVEVFTAADRVRQRGIAEHAPDKATGVAELAKWRATQIRIEVAIADVYRAIAVAAIANDDASVASLAGAALALNQQLQAAGVHK